MESVYRLKLMLNQEKNNIGDLTFFVFERFYSKMIDMHGRDLTLEEIKKKIGKEMLDLADEPLSPFIELSYSSKNSDLEEINIFLKLYKSIFKQ